MAHPNASPTAPETRRRLPAPGPISAAGRARDSQGKDTARPWLACAKPQHDTPLVPSGQSSQDGGAAAAEPQARASSQQPAHPVNQRDGSKRAVRRSLGSGVDESPHSAIPNMMDLSAHESAAAGGLYHGSIDSKSGVLDDDKWTSGEDAAGAIADDAPSSPEAETHAARKYARKSKRFAWPDELHRLFVAAIFDLGLKNASPKALLPFMQPMAAHAGLTTEHLKSHLQKYRLHYDKSRAEFLAFYEESAQRNGKRRRRSSKSHESHTKFIFPIVPQGAHAPASSATDMTIDVPPTLPEPLPPPASSPTATSPFGIPPVYSQTARHLERMNLLRLDQQNAATAAAAFALAAASLASNPSAPSMPSFPRSGFTPRSFEGPAPASAPDAGDPQWGILASLLSPQPSSTAVAPNALPAGLREPFSLGGGAGGSHDGSREAAPPDLQMQMHLAMQAQMNLHRQMLHRKVAVSQHYLNQAAAAAAAAAAEKRAALAAQPEPPRRMPVAAPPLQTTRPSLPTDSSLGPWDQMDMDIETDDAMDLFSFLKTTE